MIIWVFGLGPRPAFGYDLFESQGVNELVPSPYLELGPIQVANFKCQGLHMAAI